MTDQNKVVDHFELGNIAMQDNRLDVAIAEFKEALKSNAEFAEAYNNMGLALFNQSRFDEAIEEFRNAVRIEPAFSLAHAKTDTPPNKDHLSTKKEMVQGVKSMNCA